MVRSFSLKVTAVLALLLAPALSCKPSVDPNQGRFSCAADSDCGDGYVCRPQFGGGAFCFKTGQCADVELCNGVDDTCDGQVDESFPQQGETCATGLLGPCGAGVKACATDAGVAGIVCQSAYLPKAEVCNAVDDDCDGQVDEDFELASDDQHCGSCGRQCAVGTSCRSSRCVESRCDDGVDNDLDGGTDCEDLSCLGAACANGFNCGRAVVDGGALDAGDLDAGMPDAGELDAGLPDAGLTDAGFVGVPACVLREAICGDGADDDLDSRIDCADADCDGKVCDAGVHCIAGSCR